MDESVPFRDTPGLFLPLLFFSAPSFFLFTVQLDCTYSSMWVPNHQSRRIEHMRILRSRKFSEVPARDLNTHLPGGSPCAHPLSHCDS